MSYEEMWKEQVSFLKDSIDYLKTLVVGKSGEEKKRLLGKIDGMNTALGKMMDTERIQQK